MYQVFSRLNASQRSPVAIKEAVALGSGISILPARTMQAEIAQGRLAAVRLNAAASFLELLVGKVETV